MGFFGRKNDLPVPRDDFREIREYIAGRIRLVPEGRKLVVDEKELDRFLQTALRLRKLLPLPEEKREQLKDTLRTCFNRAAAPLPFDADEIGAEAASPQRTVVMADPTKLMADTEMDIPARANIFRKWVAVRHALVKAGARLETVPFTRDEGGTREVFMRDKYVMIGDTAFLADPQRLQDLVDGGRLPGFKQEDVQSYRLEVAQAEKTLQEQGIKTVKVEGAWFDGGNVVRHYSSRTIFFGVDQTSSLEGSAWRLLSAINEEQREEWSAVPVPLADTERFYHMDTGMSEELPRGEVMISPLVTDKETYEEICRIVGRKNIIQLKDEQARSYATNMIDIGDTLVMSCNNRSLARQLKKRGYDVVQPKDYKESSFTFGLGGVHCMTNDVKQIGHKKHRPLSL